jgi:hypothetical protein
MPSLFRAPRIRNAKDLATWISLVSEELELRNASGIEIPSLLRCIHIALTAAMRAIVIISIDAER